MFGGGARRVVESDFVVGSVVGQGDCEMGFGGGGIKWGGGPAEADIGWGGSGVCVLPNAVRGVGGGEVFVIWQDSSGAFREGVFEVGWWGCAVSRGEVDGAVTAGVNRCV